MRAVSLALGALGIAVSTVSAQTAPIVIKARTVLTRSRTRIAR